MPRESEKQKNEWKVMTLGELVSAGLVRNHNNKRLPLSSRQRAERQGGYPYYGAASAIDFIDDYRFDGLHLLVAEDGTVADGKGPMLQLVDGKFWVSNHAHVLQGKDEGLTKFLMYALKNISIAPFVTGAVQPKVTKENLYKIPLLIPSSDQELRAVTQILASLDDKIKLLREQSLTLEAAAQTLFKEWFVNFNFPGSIGKMINSELGMIPEGWKAGRLSDEFQIIMGQSPSGESYNQHGDGMIFFQGRTDFQERYPRTRLYTTEPKRIAEKFDVLVSVRAPVGDINVALERCCIGRGLAAIRSKHPSYALYKAKSLDHQLKKFNDEGTVFGAINKDSFNNIETLVPTSSVVDDFEKLAGAFDEKIYNNYTQFQILSNLRDALLPKLVTGTLRVHGQ